MNTELKEKLISKAEEMGVVDIVSFTVDQIEFDSRTLLKCMFGCEDWGNGNTCPSRPGSLKPWEYRKIFEEYSWGVIVHTNDKKLSQKISYELEELAFREGCYFAFSLSDCALCSECAGFNDESCRFPKQARPAFHSVGIDVFKTVRKFGLPIETLKKADEEKNWYSAVFVK
ncbi:DUF2284 domain-containing protein [Acetohalobium arabaticum]|uniref:Metal-binding protein n=1 Tax=Acetohalobium arabaticum (strain ATCC 49924 / DSM 5501 / Z-7288) TaxID=574087 RepID=D9QUR1_ACEAZ|nr:DUF2284 domain-containing protein [Acetohalobium arabaticum]ADL11970.1 Protein of unknown function DUF2284, metal-binding protein [Acetohalobium arabaticum DSM 5501]